MGPRHISDLPTEVIDRIFQFVDMESIALCWLHIPQLDPFALPQLVQRVPHYQMFVGDEAAAVEAFSCMTNERDSRQFTYLPARRPQSLGFYERGGFVIEHHGLRATFHSSVESPPEFTLCSSQGCHMGLGCAPEWHTTYMYVQPHPCGVASFEHRHNGFDAVHCNVIHFDLRWFAEAITSCTGLMTLHRNTPPCARGTVA
jgi:hypothetical protein